MNITVQGGIKSPVPGTQTIVDSLRGAGRMSFSPFDHSDGQGNLLGHYRMSVNTSGFTAVAAGGVLAAAQYTDRHSVMIPLKISVGCAITTANGTATNITDAEVVAVRNYTTPQTGGTALVPFAATNSQKNRGNMGNPLLADLRIGTTANLTITAASWVVDSQGFGIAPMNISIIGAAGLADFRDLYKYDEFGSHPMVFGAFEGWAIRLPHGFNNGTQASSWYFTYEWAELALYS